MIRVNSTSSSPCIPFSLRYVSRNFYVSTCVQHGGKYLSAAVVFESRLLCRRFPMIHWCRVFANGDWDSHVQRSQYRLMSHILYVFSIHFRNFHGQTTGRRRSFHLLLCLWSTTPRPLRHVTLACHHFSHLLFSGPTRAQTIESSTRSGISGPLTAKPLALVAPGLGSASPFFPSSTNIVCSIILYTSASRRGCRPFAHPFYSL